jgi:hypothetical protein
MPRAPLRPRERSRRCPPAFGPRPLVALAWLASFGCGPETISAVDPPIGFYVPNAMCVTREGGGAACPTGAQFGFERATDHLDFQLDKPAAQQNARVSCQRTFCGTGAFAYHAIYRWPRGVPGEMADRYHDVSYKFPQPVDMRGKTLTARIFVESFTTPLNAQLAIVQSRGRYRIIFDGPLLSQSGWNTVGGIVGPENPKAFSPGETVPAMVPVSDLMLVVYLSTDVRSGDRENWESDVYFDEIGWR